MFAYRKPLWCKSMAVWQSFFCLSVFAFLLRAFIPVGYMPDSSIERKTPFAITLCSVGGPTFIQVNLDGQSQPSHPDSRFNPDTCPFGLNLAQELLPGQAVAPLVVASFQTVVSVLRNQALPVMPAVGPPLGSRAPPSNSEWQRV